MAKHSSAVQVIALKLGLSEEDKVLSKAAEFERLLRMKSTANNITDTAKAVICLDLAATHYRVDFDQKTAVKSSGLKGPSYVNSKKIIENVLELNNDRLTIPSLCLTMQCSVEELAQQILEEYNKTSKMVLEMDLPQYVCMAVYQACRITNVKVPKSKFIDKAQLKPAQWSKLDAEWTKFTDEKFAAFAKKKRGRPAKNTAIEDAEEMMDIDTEITQQKESMEPQIESYEDWRTRILEAAYRELEIQKQNQTMSKLRQSPRKLNLSNNLKEMPNNQIEMPNKHKEAPNKQKFQSDKPTLSANKKLDFELSPIKQKEMTSKLKDTPSKYKETYSKDKETPSKHKDTPSKHKDTPSKYKDTPSKQKDTPSKQKDNASKLIDDGSIVLDFGLPRRSPRKTPQKYEPYQSPTNKGGITLVFPGFEPVLLGTKGKPSTE